MDRGTKVALGIGVLIVGVVAALAFRRNPTSGRPSMPEPRNQLVLRQSPEARGSQSQATDAVGRGPGGAGASSDPTSPRKPVTILTPMDHGDPPPALATSYPDQIGRPTARPGADSRWGTSMSVGLPAPRRSGPRTTTHTVVDGDSLRSLAAQYLGSDRRWPEIYQANRELLGSPDVLPIGATLRIPLEGQTADDAGTPGVRRTLTPVPPPSRPLTGAGNDR